MQSEPSEAPSALFEADAAEPLMLRRPCPPDFAGLVTDIVGYREGGQRLDASVEMASLVVPLVISFGGAFEIGLGRAPTPDDRFASFTSGLFPGHVLINSDGAAECIQVNFTPTGARRFFGLPMHEISRRMVSLDELGDSRIGALRRRLGDERSWPRRLDLVIDFVRTRLTGNPTSDTAVRWAYERLLRTDGKIRIARLASDIGWSRKHLVERFRDEIGLGPKSVARIARFNAALALARQGGEGWADIAAACGYADQAHLAREFREFSGVTPAAASLGHPAAAR
ncbi:MAG: helix-turn-helix transcriptional regulator [Mesorhizobium sp.]|nr:helix-turn-helix transcriptional regulator [Mesorhizobium sp.]